MSDNMKVGQRVKWSEYVIRGKRDYWLRQGSYTLKSAARRYLDEAIAARGTIINASANGYTVRMDGETGTHSVLENLVEPAND